MQRLLGISVVALALVATAAIGLPAATPSSAESKPARELDSLLGLSGDALFERLGVPSQSGTAGGRLESWFFADGKVEVTLISDQVIQVEGELPDDFEPLQRPESGFFQGQTIGEVVKKLGEPLEIHLGSQSINLVFEGERECAVIGPRGRIAF